MARRTRLQAALSAGEVIECPGLLNAEDENERDVLFGLGFTDRSERFPECCRENLS
jgi:hypothetical protein